MQLLKIIKELAPKRFCLHKWEDLVVDNDYGMHDHIRVVERTCTKCKVQHLYTEGYYRPREYIY